MRTSKFWDAVGAENRNGKRGRLRRIRERDALAFRKSLEELQFNVYPAMTLRMGVDMPAQYWTIGFNQPIPVAIGEEVLTKIIMKGLEELKNGLEGEAEEPIPQE